MISANVDLRSSYGAAHHQGQRPTCLAFALSDLNRFYSQAPTELSAEYLYQSAAAATPGWQPDDGLLIHAALAAIARPGQPSEATYPYADAEPIAPLTPLPVFDPMYATTFQSVAHGMNEVIASLQAGLPLGLVIKVSSEFFSPVDGIVAFSPLVLPHERHAIIAVGWGIHIQTLEPHALIRNSWGEEWGVKGHAWLPASYIDIHTVTAFGI